MEDISGTKVLVAAIEGADNKNLRTMVDNAKNQVGSGIILIANVADGKVGLIAGVTKDLIGKVKARVTSLRWLLSKLRLKRRTKNAKAFHDKCENKDKRES
ncbi:DHHA1 domain-containing protein [Enterovibrio norvegicus]|uniref:DHHA1 domain-containing protein n=1 Tax=Enterovibrio norvegicus TaxID=188144 RepID=UPI0039AF1CBF